MNHRSLFPNCVCEECVPRRWWCEVCGHPFSNRRALSWHRRSSLHNPRPEDVA